MYMVLTRALLRLRKDNDFVVSLEGGRGKGREGREGKVG